MNRENDYSTKSIWLYLLLIAAFWVFSFLTLSFWLKPYSIAYENTGRITLGYLVYALIGMLFTTPAPFLSVLILAVFRDRMRPKVFFARLLHTEKPLPAILLTAVFCLLALVFALLRGTPNGSPWYIMPLGFLVMVPFVGIAEEAGLSAAGAREADEVPVKCFGGGSCLGCMAHRPLVRPDVKSFWRQLYRFHHHNFRVGVCSGGII